MIINAEVLEITTYSTQNHYAEIDAPSPCFVELMHSWHRINTAYASELLPELHPDVIMHSHIASRSYNTVTFYKYECKNIGTAMCKNSCVQQ